MNLWRTILAAALLQAGGLAVAGWWMRQALNTDAIAYLRIAGYYLAGQNELALTGYWGPLLSWLIAPLLSLGLAKLVAVRVVMAGSAMIFWWGCLALFHSLELPPRWLKLGIWLAAAVSIPWSVANITPDLLLAGWVALALAGQIQAVKRDVYHASSFFIVVAGVCWGMAYYTKAIALPLALLTIPAYGVVWRWRARKDWPGIVKQCSLIMGVFLLLATPWIGALSVHYNKPVFSTTAAIAHAVAGPVDQERYHPFVRQFHVPEANRITAWEEPSRMNYAYWAPWDSGSYLWHQIKLSAVNFGKLQLMLTGICLLWPVLLVVCVVRCARPDRDDAFWRQRWWWAVMPLAALMLALLPGYLEVRELRFMFVVFPLLMVMAVETVAWLEVRSTGRVSQQLGMVAVALAFLLPALAWGVYQLPNKDTASRCAQDLAIRLRQHQFVVPLAGAATLPGGRTGLYTAFFLGQPWYGDEVRPTVESIRKSGAKLYLVLRQNPLVTELSRAAGFRNLDNELFASQTEANQCPVMVFQVPQRSR
ncbi:MAG: hypothetical protein WCO56_06890 [Verrucomicrobiota bacterium]